MAVEKLNIYGLNKLPSFPHIIVKILETLQDEWLDAGKLASLIEMDGPLCAKLLTAANSPIFRTHQVVRTIREAIQLLGWDMVKTLALSTAMHQIVNDLSAREKVDLHDFWRHSLYTAVIGKKLAACVSDVSEDEAYLSGLLHDIGRLALRMNYPTQYNAVFDSRDSEAYLLFEEMRLLGTNHCEVGSWLVRDWQVGTFLQDSIAFHHKPPELLEQTTDLVKIVHMAASMSESYPHILVDQLKNAKAWFDLEFQDLDKILGEANLQVHAMASSMNIHIVEDNVADNAPRMLKEVQDDLLEAEALVANGGGASKSSYVMENMGVPLNTPAYSPEPATEPPMSSVMAQTMLIDHLEKMINREQDDYTFYTSLLHTAWMICGAKQILVFEADLSKDILKGRKTHPDLGWIESFSFPIKHDVGMISDALLYRGMTDSLQQQEHAVINLAERQMMRLSQVDSMVCMPMLLGQKQLGVMVFAMESRAAKEAVSQSFMIKALTRIAAIQMNLRNEQQAKATAAADEPLPIQLKRQELDKFLHETSNPLSTIRNYLEILRRKASGDTNLDQDIRIVDDEINRVTQLINQFVESSTLPTEAMTSINVNQAIRDVVALQEATSLKPFSISVNLSLGEDLPEIVSNAYKVRQILINLIKNAAEAMPHGGELSISTFTEYMPNQEKWVLIHIQDNGTGIEQHVRSRIFGTVETAKGGNHKGLGLSIVAELVEALGGKVGFRSRVGVGTVFDIRLPCHHQNPLAQSNPP